MDCKSSLFQRCSLIVRRLLPAGCVAIVLSAIPISGSAQLTEHAVSKENWKVYGKVKSIGVSKATLEYKVNASDTSFFLLLEDERKELKNFFSIGFSSRGNTLQELYSILISFFEKENWNNEDYMKSFTLGETKVRVYKAPGLIQLKTITISTDKGRMRLTRNEINPLFNR